MTGIMMTLGGWREVRPLLRTSSSSTNQPGKRSMIRKVEGDILESKAQFIAHGIAPQDHFDTGLALALRERWPSLVRDYRHAIHGKPLASGEIWAWRGVDADGSTRGIVNMLTQDMLGTGGAAKRSEEHTSELQSRGNLVCRLLLENKKK